MLQAKIQIQLPQKQPHTITIVTGFWKIDQIVTLDFIGPANSYTHTLPIHSAITRLG